MSDLLTALASENLNPSLRSLLEDVQRGHIRVPRFQRPFVWTDLQRLDLLRSVRDNMPIGSLLVWRTSQFKLASFPSVGPHCIPPILENAPATGWQYLLDGHQRVSTLLGLLLQPVPVTLAEPISDEDPIDWDIQYDLMDEDFVFAPKIGRKGAKHPLLPLWTLFDGRLVNKRMREMRKQGEIENWTEGDLDTWEVRADQLSYRFQQCRIPIVVMVSDNLELAAKTFQRINSLGTPMSEAHLVAALTWNANFDLRERLDELREALPSGWRNIGEGIFLQVCKGLSGLDMTKAGQTELVRKLTEDTTLLERAGQNLKRAVMWFSDSTLVVQQELLPYAFQLILLAVELERWKDSEPPKSALLAWFWRTGWSEVFATASYRQVRTEQENLRNATDNKNNSVWERDKLPDRFDFRSARVRLFLLRLAAQPELYDAYGHKTNGRDILISHGRDAFVQLFPTPRHQPSPALKRLLQGAGNRFLIDPNQHSLFRDQLKDGPDLSSEVLRSHFIDDESLQSLRQGDLESFVRQRAELMNKWDEEQWRAEKKQVSEP